MASIVQSAVAATSTNSPTSVTPTFGSGTTAGNLLVLFVGVVSDGTTQSITTPASWTLVTSGAGAINRINMFIYPNNPGSITSVAVTIAATNGGGVGVLLEVSGMPSSPVLEYSNLQNDGASGTSLLSVFTNPPGTLSELALCGIAHTTASTFTAAGLNSLGSAQRTGTSTNGTSANVVLDVFAALTTGYGQPTFSGTLNASVPYHSIGALYPQSAAVPITYDNVGGAGGVYVPQFYQGSIGG